MARPIFVSKYLNILKNREVPTAVGIEDGVPEGRCSCKGSSERSSKHLRCTGTGTARLASIDIFLPYNLSS